jgi:diguanylate cyclase (GGDEF)-like protein
VHVPLATPDRLHPTEADGAPPAVGIGAPNVHVAGIALATAVVVLALASTDAYWLCLPGALLASALTTTTPGAIFAAAAVAASAQAALILRGVSPLPPVALAVLVPAACVAVQACTHRRLERERDQLRGVALTDALTGVANRRMLLARADYEIARHTRESHRFALVMLDLDGFKALNDRFGHAAGDEILREVAASLCDALRAQDTIARLGGDEFCVLAPETDPTGVPALAVRIGDAVADVTAGVTQLGASIGIAVFPDDGDTTAGLLEAADQRLLDSKRALYGRGRRRAA